MAEATLRADSARANPNAKIRDLSLMVQEKARQVTALADAISDALDWSTKDEALRERLGRADSLLIIVRERGETIAGLGEDIERRAGHASLEEKA